MDLSAARPLQALEDEKARFTCIIAELSVQNQILKEVGLKGGRPVYKIGCLVVRWSSPIWAVSAKQSRAWRASALAGSCWNSARNIPVRAGQATEPLVPREPWRKA